MKRLLTIQRTDTPDSVSRAISTLESAVNSLADVGTSDLPNRMDKAESEIKDLQTEQTELAKEIEEHHNAKLTPEGYLLGQVYDGTEDVTFSIAGSPNADAGQLAARDANGGSAFKKLTIKNTGHELLVLERSESSEPAPGANYQFILVRRNGETKAIIGIDDMDRFCVIKGDGSDVQAYLDTDGTWFATFLKAQNYFDAANHQLLMERQPAISDAVATTGSPAGTDNTGGSPTDPATLGDVQGAYNVTNAHEARIADLEGTVATVRGTLNTVLGMLRTHGLIFP